MKHSIDCLCHLECCFWFGLVCFFFSLFHSQSISDYLCKLKITIIHSDWFMWLLRQKKKRYVLYMQIAALYFVCFRRRLCASSMTDLLFSPMIFHACHLSPLGHSTCQLYIRILNILASLLPNAINSNCVFARQSPLTSHGPHRRKSFLINSITIIPLISLEAFNLFSADT